MFWSERIEVIIIDPMINGMIRIKILVATFVIIQIPITLEILNRFLYAYFSFIIIS
jgi:hypothetical protein